MVLLAPAAGTAAGVRLAPCKTFGLYPETGFQPPSSMDMPLGVFKGKTSAQQVPHLGTEHPAHPPLPAAR